MTVLHTSDNPQDKVADQEGVEEGLRPFLPNSGRHLAVNTP